MPSFIARCVKPYEQIQTRPEEEHLGGGETEGNRGGDLDHIRLRALDLDASKGILQKDWRPGKIFKAGRIGMPERLRGSRDEKRDASDQQAKSYQRSF